MWKILRVKFFRYGSQNEATGSHFCTVLCIWPSKTRISITNLAKTFFFLHELYLFFELFQNPDIADDKRIQSRHSIHGVNYSLQFFSFFSDKFVFFIQEIYGFLGLLVFIRFRRGAVPACKLPELDLLNPEIMKFIHDVPALDCGPEDWVVVEGSKLSILDKAKSRYGSITCAFSGTIRLQWIFIPKFLINYKSSGKVSSTFFLFNFRNSQSRRLQYETNRTSWIWRLLHFTLQWLCGRSVWNEKWQAVSNFFTLASTDSRNEYFFVIFSFLQSWELEIFIFFESRSMFKFFWHSSVKKLQKLLVFVTEDDYWSSQQDNLGNLALRSFRSVWRKIDFLRFFFPDGTASLPVWRKILR